LRFCLSNSSTNRKDLDGALTVRYSCYFFSHYYFYLPVLVPQRCDWLHRILYPHRSKEYENILTCKYMPVRRVSWGFWAILSYNLSLNPTVNLKGNKIQIVMIIAFVRILLKQFYSFITLPRKSFYLTRYHIEFNVANVSEKLNRLIFLPNRAQLRFNKKRRKRKKKSLHLNMLLHKDLASCYYYEMLFTWNYFLCFNGIYIFKSLPSHFITSQQN